MDMSEMMVLANTVVRLLALVWDLVKTLARKRE